MTAESVNILPLGMEDRATKVIETVLKKRYSDVCVVTEAKQAHIALVDLDAAHAATHISEFRNKYPGRPLIGISKSPSKLNVDVQVQRPLDLNRLVIAIRNLANPESTQQKNIITQDKIEAAMRALDNKNLGKSLSKRAEGQTGTTPGRAMPKKTDEMCFNPERFLLGHILNVVKETQENNKIAVLTCWGDKMIVIDPSRNEISTSLNDNQIRTLAIAPIDDNLSSPIVIKYYQAGVVDGELDTLLKREKVRHYTLEAFTWNLGVLTCRGRIPLDASVSERQYLRRWPNLTRMIVPDNAMRIIAYWVQQPSSLLNIKAQLDVPLQDVFTVYSAAYSAGLAGTAKRKADELLGVIELAPNTMRGLMSSVIGRLRGLKPTPYSQTA